MCIYMCVYIYLHKFYNNFNRATDWNLDLQLGDHMFKPHLKANSTFKFIRVIGRVVFRSFDR